jgi:hypothetical protein
MGVSAGLCSGSTEDLDMPTRTDCQTSASDIC